MSLAPVSKSTHYLPPDYEWTDQPQAKKTRNPNDEALRPNFTADYLDYVPFAPVPPAEAAAAIADLPPLSSSIFTKIPLPSLAGIAEFPPLPAQEDAPPALVTDRILPTQIDDSHLASTKDLLDKFAQEISSENQKPSACASLAKDLVATADQIFTHFNIMFPIYVPNTDHYEGHIEKAALPIGAVATIRADIHGDWDLLKTYLDYLQKEGVLDENYQCCENKHIVILGDFTGRYPYDLHISCILARMKIEQPDKIHILKGNHEEPRQLAMEFQPSLSRYRHHQLSELEARHQRISDFASRLPIGLFLYTENDNQSRDYVACVHASLDPTVNLRPLLDGEKDILVVPKLTPANLQHYQATVSLPTELDECIQALWNSIRSFPGQFFLSNYFSPQTIHSSAYTWGSVLPSASRFFPTTQKYLFTAAPMRQCGEVSCSRVALAKIATLSSLFHRITRLYRGHDHSPSFMPATQEAPLNIRTLSWETFPSAPYKLETAFLIFGKEEVTESWVAIDKTEAAGRA